MLTAFAARPIVELKQRDKSKIESVLAHGNRVFVGLNTGSLRIYNVNEASADEDGLVQPSEAAESPSSASKQSQQAKTQLAELRREVEKFSRKAIVQLAIIKDANVLVSLSDGYVSFHDLETYSLSERLDATKGATAFATIRNIVNDPETHIASIVSRLAVAIRRKLVIWTWQDMELVNRVQEFNVAATIKCLTWATGSSVLVGMDPGFSLVNIESGEISDINRAAEVDEAGAPVTSRFGAVSASGMGYMGMGSYLPKPMATKLSDDNLLLAKDVNTLFIDSVGNPLEKRQVPWATSPEAVGYSYPYLLSLQQPTRGKLDLRNPDTLSLLQSISLPNATLLHVPQPNISLAHAGKGFLVASERCIWRMDAMSYGPQVDELVQHAKFDEALSLVNLIEDTLLLDKHERMRDIKIRKAHALFHKRSYREALELFSDAQAQPHIVIALYPESIAGNLSLDSTSSDTDKLEASDLNTAVQELTRFLAQTRINLQKYIEFDGTLKLPSDSLNEASETTLPPFSHLVQFDEEPHDVDWQQKLLETATLVYTTLFRAYLLIKPGLVGPLVRVDNFCDAQVVEDKLYEKGLYSELIDFLHAKKLHEDALRLLERLGKETTEDEAPSEFQGPNKIVKYLQQVPFELVDLILRYAEWPLSVTPDLGMEVFLADNDNAESLPRKKVLEFLDKINSDLTIRYLEHIINELHDQTVDFHDQLATLHISHIEAAAQNDQGAQEEQDKLEHLLKESNHYSKSKILKQLPTNDKRFCESRATILRKLQRHREALQIYVYEMEDYKKAEDYCNQVYHAATTSSTFKIDPDDTDSIYTVLLNLYLKPPSPHTSNPDAALELLSVHGSRLPALETLAALPLSLPIKDLEGYFRTRMRAANTVSREEAIVASLSKVEKIGVESDLLLGRDWDSRSSKKDTSAGRNRRVVLKEDMLCSVCNKRFGRAAARLWPDGRVVHYGCSDRGR